MRISDWSSDVCSSDLVRFDQRRIADEPREAAEVRGRIEDIGIAGAGIGGEPALHQRRLRRDREKDGTDRRGEQQRHRSEEHTSELQSLMRISYAVFCLNTNISLFFIFFFFFFF